MAMKKRYIENIEGEEEVEESIVRANLQARDEKDASYLRPRMLSDFQGQEKIRENLSVFIEAAKQREEALDHVFFIGPPGLGKTTLAQIVANELGVEFKVTGAPALEKPKDLAGILTTLSPRSLFFIDEIHRLKPAIEEMLYIAMEDYELDWVVGQGPGARTVRIPLPKFTLAGATTKAGMVSSPLISRFGIVQRFEFYSFESLSSIIMRSSQILKIKIDEKAAFHLATCSRGTPRIANRLLKRMRDFAQVAGKSEIDIDIVDRGLEQLNIDSMGLETCDRQILRSIIENYSGGPVGAETLAISIGEGQETLEDYYEPYLIQSGLLQRTPRGRVATEKAYKILGLPTPKFREESNINLF